MTHRRTMAALCAALACAAGAQAQISDDVVRIGFVSDMSGLYRDYDGPAGAEAIRMAIADMGGTVNGKKIELLTVDHQNKADIAAAKAREWFDVNRLDMLIGGVGSGAAIAMAGVAAEKKRPYFVVGAGASGLTNEHCSPYTVHYAYDTVAMARGTANAVARSGGKSWYFVTADYAFGTALQADASKTLEANGGTVAGAVKHPLGANDFSSFMLQAQASKAQVLALANAGSDTVNAIKSAAEFGIGKTMKLAGMIITINDVHALGLKTAQGMFLTDSWYWNQSPEARAWARRFFDKHKRMPTSFHAGDYSAALQYLKAVQAAGTDDGDKVMAQLRRTKVNDMFMQNGWLREDGLMVHDMRLVQVKTPAESQEPWDYYKVVETIAGEAAWTTKAESRCARWKAL
ncbi:branched-chain amino acid ABC transporter substrate-binding protein [Pseudorhodoferax aquiterrae]|uniref:Branched-chain amino acid ABC transporter substrate-binding protein n=1 Tax=Pseudorhodoferax aquiterrae TaxID=747304 RepID=A0ABQ3G0W8_9BURK|nr:ABC transporter substrate-binding protein [Pseudorhodoferax aquiterrae]GHC78459.1 branched-chain amino acid ABC transporter substrate-binding protein [Pseudorhodoferax aquiterrae]